MASMKFRVNGSVHTIEADPRTPLLWVLRDTLGLTGTKFSCGQGLCGSCTVHLDGEPFRSCITPAQEAAGRAITTIEGLAAAGSHPVLSSWIAEEVPQCGYCQPGQIMSAVALLRETPDPSDADIDAAMSTVLCRCGTYGRIRRAIHRAAAEGGAPR